MAETATLPSIAEHGASRLPSVEVDSYNIELKDDEGFIGDRASKGAFREIIENWRKSVRKAGDDPFGEEPLDRSGGDPTRILAREQSVLDLITADIQDLYSRAPQSGRAQLDSHLAGIRELEASIKAQLQTGGVALPPRPAELLASDSSNHPAIVNAHFQLIRSAFQLDLTRVVTMSFGTSNSFVDFADIIGGSQFSENIDYPFASFGVHALAHRDEGKTSQTLLAITDWYAQRTAELVTLLAGSIDVDGSSLLDSTLVVLFSECSEAHDHDNIPVCLFGGSKLGLSGNRCLRYEGRAPNDLWAALAPALGLPLTTFGDPDQYQAPLPGVVVPA